MRVIKDKTVIEDSWELVRELEDITAIPQRDIILPFRLWQQHREALLQQNRRHAVWIDGDIDTEELLEDLSQFDLIGLDFPAFKDGRSYSHARLLKQRYDYKGELRAVGDVLCDQLFFMLRCGIDSFQLREDKNVSEALDGFNSFTVCYQAAADDALPIYKQR